MYNEVNCKFLMAENQVLLSKEYSSQRPIRKSRPYPCVDENDGKGSSSDGSDEWWEESYSSCSSCCNSTSEISFEWEAEIEENGQLFYIESEQIEVPEALDKIKEQNLAEDLEKSGKKENVKKGRLVNWMRRKNGKKSQLKVAEHSGESSEPLFGGAKKNYPFSLARKEFKLIALKIEGIGRGATVCEKLLGLALQSSEEGKVVVVNVLPDGPARNCREISIGDILLEINSFFVTPQNIENVLQSLHFPCELILKFQNGEQPQPSEKAAKFQSPFVQSLLSKNSALDEILLHQPVGVVVVDVESQNLNKDDVIYSYPEKSVLSSCRGAFVTLFHLISEIKPNDICQSSSVLIKKQPTHVLYKSEDNFLLLIAVPKVKCSLKEAIFIVNDLIRNLLFTHQTLKRCFKTCEKPALDQFFSLFFGRLLTNGFSSGASSFVTSENISKLSSEPGSSEFEDILPFANFVPLPKEAQVQIDEALNELEANDFECEEEISIENKRLFNFVGSCLFHKGYLLASHLPKDDLLDVYSFYRQHGLIQLFRNEPVKSLVIWREVFPLSFNRGLHSKKPSNYPTPSGRWFILTVGQKYDALTVILEAGEYCAKTEENPGPAIAYVEETEDTLKHMQHLGISNLASQWIDSNCRFKTVTPEEIFSRKSTRKKDNLLDFVKTFDGTSKPPVSKTLQLKPGDTNFAKTIKGVQAEGSEDSTSQTASNVSEISDENAPILGRRGERGRVAGNDNASGDSDSSDSDWDSSRDSNMRESISSGVDNLYLGDVGELLPARLTTGPEDVLFYYVHLDGSEGVFLSPPINSKRSSPKMTEILTNFRRSAQIIHSVLGNNNRFKKTGQDKNATNKSLVAVKEHGVLFECCLSESDSAKKPNTFNYWVVGRLFFTPQPREIYICYHEEAPQNLVEIAFRLGLCAAG